MADAGGTGSVGGGDGTVGGVGVDEGGGRGGEMEGVDWLWDRERAEGPSLKESEDDTGAGGGPGVVAIREGAGYGFGPRWWEWWK